MSQSECLANWTTEHPNLPNFLAVIPSLWIFLLSLGRTVQQMLSTMTPPPPRGDFDQHGQPSAFGPINDTTFIWLNRNIFHDQTWIISRSY